MSQMPIDGLLVSREDRPKVNVIDSVFVLPYIFDESGNGEIYLAQRGTEPQKGKWGAIGGKTESREVECPFDVLQKMYTFGGHVKTKVVDTMCDKDKELFGEAAIREFCEEMFADKNYPIDFGRYDFSHILHLGSFVDLNLRNLDARFNLEFYLACVYRNDFHFSDREITGLKPLSTIDVSDIWLGTQYALEHARWAFSEDGTYSYFGKIGREDVLRLCDDPVDGAKAKYASLDISSSIPKIPITVFRDGSLLGAHRALYFGNH